MNAKERRWEGVFDMRKVLGVKDMERIRKRDIRGRCGIQVSLSFSLSLGMDGSNSLMMVWYIERLEERRMTKRTYRADLEGAKRMAGPGGGDMGFRSL